MEIVNLSNPNQTPKDGDKIRKVFDSGAYEEVVFCDPKVLRMLDKDIFGNWIYKFKITDDFRKKIADKLNSLPTVLEGSGARLEDKATLSTRGDKSYQRTVTPKDVSDTEWRLIVEEFLSEVKKNAEKIQEVEDVSEFNIRQCWEVVGEEGGYHLLHRHRNLYNKENEAVEKRSLSIVTYLDVPASDPPHGCFVYLIIDDNGYIIPKTFKPEEGDVFVFSPYLIHGANPQVKGVRRTFNCEVDW